MTREQINFVVREAIVYGVTVFLVISSFTYLPLAFSIPLSFCFCFLPLYIFWGVSGGAHRACPKTPDRTGRKSEQVSFDEVPRLPDFIKDKPITIDGNEARWR